MRRGDIVTIVAPGDYGKPRPAIVVQSDHLTGAESVLVCPLTTTERDAPLFRLLVPASSGSGLRTTSYIVVEKMTAVSAKRCGPVIGAQDGETMRLLDGRIAFCVGLADGPA